jgi:hypothetical protein
VITSEQAQDVLEWGCGYRSIELAIPPTVSFSCVDLDPQVVKWQSARGCRCYHTSEPLPPAQYDAMVSIFVFHFHIAPAEFERAGLTVVSRDDPLALCARHEYWAMSRTRSFADLAALLARIQS